MSDSYTAFEIASRKASKINPINAANNCCYKYTDSITNGYFSINFLNREIKLTFPGFNATYINDTKVEISIVTLILFHLINSDGEPLENKWISYADLPGGGYSNAMKTYTSDLLEKHFKDDTSKLYEAAKSLRGEKIDLCGDLSIRFQAFPKVPIALVYWKGNDEFPASQASFLFDSSAPHHLPSDCYAILCSWLASELISFFDC